MNTLGNMATGLQIGDGAVSVYLEMTRNKKCGGLFHKTTDNGYRMDNMYNNYPRLASFYYTQSKMEEKPVESKRFLGGNIITAYNLDGLDIGWAYTTDINKNRLSKGFISSSDFDNFQKLLRDERKPFVINDEYSNIVIKKYADNIINNENGNKFGSEYTLETRQIYIKNNDLLALSNNNIINNLETNLPYNSLMYYAIDGEIDIDNISNNDIYKVSTNNGIYDFNITKDNGGNLLNINNNTNVKTYNYYPENEKGSSEKDFTKSKNIIQGNNIDKFNNGDNTSRLLKKTNELFKQGTIKTLINRFHTEKIGNDELVTSKTEYGMSRGRNLLMKNGQVNKDTIYEDPYCRVWTAHHQYSKLNHRIRPFNDDNGNNYDLTSLHLKFGSDLRPNSGMSLNNSTLQSNGFVKITPYNNNDDKNGRIKNYMFSIENLAWKDILINNKNNILSKSQIGPNNGRIMWFPPYNLKFTENINVNWNPNSFIGRGEQIYTYTNTERSGTLDFSILIDHPSILNKWRGTSGDYEGEKLKEKEDEILRFFAGCDLLEIEGDKNNSSKVGNNIIENEYIETKLSNKEKKIAYVIFFPNNFSGFDDLNKNIKDAFLKLSFYENGNSGTTNYCDTKFKEQILNEINKTNNNIYSLNNSNLYDEKIKKLLNLNDENIELHHFSELIKFDGEKSNDLINKSDTGDKLFGYLKSDYDISNIDYYGFASSHGNKINNLFLSENRYKILKKYIEQYCNFSKDIPFTVKNSEIEVSDIDGLSDVNSLDAKIARSAVVIFNISKKINVKPINEQTINSVNGYNLHKDVTNESKGLKEYSNNTYEDVKGEYEYGNEYLYFSELAKDEYMVKNIVNRIKHFDPAFHSITPEGFNARLTFLHQCTRQGPTNSLSSGNITELSNDYLKYAGNLSFGRAPYCILRIGDFFYTKICIDSISINYDNGNGIQWDLNPEGSGVQPMMANISINFKFIGGQDIGGPIEKLQNAISSNYYANASIYDKNAEIKK